MSQLFDRLSAPGAVTTTHEVDRDPQMPRGMPRKAVIFGTLGLLVAIVAAILMLQATKHNERVEAAAKAQAAAEQAKARQDLSSLGQTPGTGIPAGPVAAASPTDFTVETPADRFSLATAQQLQQDLSQFDQEVPPENRTCENLNPDHSSGRAGMAEQICKQETNAVFWKCTRNIGKRWDVTIPGCAR